MYSFLKNRKIRFSNDGKFVSYIEGVDMQAKMPVILQENGYLVFKRNGFTGRVSIGETGHYPPVYYLIRIEDGTITDVIYEIEVNRDSWRGVRKWLIVSCLSLAAL